jgi:hypothetical protein
MRTIPVVLLLAMVAPPSLVLGQDAKDEAAKAIAARRAQLQDLRYDSKERGRLPAKEQEQMDLAIERALEGLKAALEGTNTAVFDAAGSDWINGEYRLVPKDKVLPILLAAVKPLPEAGDKGRMRSLLLYYMSRQYGPAAQDILPNLVARVTNDKLDAYVRGSAIYAAARIGAGEPTVIAAFIEALKNPNPKNVSGVHDGIIGELAGMGRPAWPAKQAIADMLGHPWYQDGAFLALGTLARDEKPREVAFYFKQLERGDKIPPEESAAAFLHVRLAAKMVMGGKKIDETVAQAARPILLKIVEERPNDIYAREALRTLQLIGAGPSARAVKLFVRNILRDRAPEAFSALEATEATDKNAVAPLLDGLVTALERPGKHDWYTRVMLARAIGRYGKEARPAAPHLLKALRATKSLPEPGHADVDVFTTYVDVLAALDGNEPGVRQGILDLMAPDGVLKNSVKSGPLVHQRLLSALATLGLSNKADERKLSLLRVREGLDSREGRVFAAAANVLIRHEGLSKEEAQPLVPLLARVLPEKFAFEKDDDGASAIHGRRVAAIKALSALGAAAKNVVPQLEVWAKKPLEKSGPSFSRFAPDPPVNQVIREAERALVRIKKADEGQ